MDQCCSWLGRPLPAKKALMPQKIKGLVGRLKGLYVKSFDFKETNQYDSSDLDPIRAQLKEATWVKADDTHESASGTNTEVYLMKKGKNIIGLAVLVAAPNELAIVNIGGIIKLDNLRAFL